MPIGFIFGFGLYHAGFTDSRKIARAFYLKDVGVPVVMFSAIVTGMLGLWLLSLVGFIDTSQMYYLPTYLMPMAVGGLLFGVGMAIGGFCPGTAAASIATGRIDAMVFVIGFLGGSILFGDLFPVWGDFYNSDYRGVYRLDELFGINLGSVVLILAVASVAGSLFMRLGQRLFWSTPRARITDARAGTEIRGAAGGAGAGHCRRHGVFPDRTVFCGRPRSSWYIIQKQAVPARHASEPRARRPRRSRNSRSQAPARSLHGGEGC